MNDNIFHLRPKGRWHGVKPPREPMFNLPPMTKALLATSIGVYLVMMVLSADALTFVMQTFAVRPNSYTQLGNWNPLPLVSYMFIHAGTGHILFNGVTLAAFGSGIERVLGMKRMLGFFLLTGVVGVLAHIAVYPDSVVPVVGASGAISGLFAGILRLFSLRISNRDSMRGLGIVAMIWIGFSVLEGIRGGGNVAWVAHVGGFVAGLAVFDMFLNSPGRNSRSRPGPRRGNGFWE
ncbi:MAG: rhomboid family intramembrane serine protease [Pseudomonadota bacterium]|nr:rhomboid family intramembrane serine protease [Pseudomonadota bacterium]